MKLLGGSPAPAQTTPVVVTGAALGLPGGGTVFADDNVDRILHGKQLIDVIPIGLRNKIVDKKITRLVKSDSGGGPRFETIDSVGAAIKLAGQGGDIRLESDFGVPADRVRAMDSTTQMAVAVGLEALRDAGIPLVLRYKTTTKGTKLPDRWVLPEDMRDDTGIIFGSAFPGLDSFAEQMASYYEDQARRRELADIEALRGRLGDSSDLAARELDRRIHELRADIERAAYGFDRRFLFRVLSMGHSQFAEHIGARGPNTQINSACASGTLAVGLAEDWIRAGRCRRVIIVTADNASGEHLIEWVGAGFLASGAAATDELLEEAALPFDRRRHGMILGMGASAMVIESVEAAAERGLRPICEVLGVVTANSAYHGSRLDVEHIGGLMDKLVAEAEERYGIDRREIAASTVFVSHETYTPARGGSAQAEVNALRRVFGDAADQVVIANTKGMTGHAMGAGIEDVVAVKILETGLVPPIANFKEVDPDLGELNLSRGGTYPVRYALRLGAGFGSQISLSLSRWVPSPSGRRPATDQLGHEYRVDDRGAFDAWLRRASGSDSPRLVVENRALRIADEGMPKKRAPALAVTAVPAPAPAPALAPVEDGIKARVLAVVAEQTGYPPDMLDLDLDLEADLGIDTVKQAETFAAVREAYDIPRDENLQLRNFPTLAHVIGFVKDRLPGGEGEGESARESVSAGATGDEGIAATVLAVVAEQTGYPPEMLDLDLDLEADLGIDTVKQAETFAAVREAYDIPRDENLQLRDFPTLAHVIGFVKDRLPGRESEGERGGESVNAGATGDAEIAATVLAVVAEQTGYPPEMLDLDLDLEADLGIDTVKQAETFAAVREAYDIPRDENLQLRDFPTLASVIGFVKDRLPGGEGEPAPEGESAGASEEVVLQPGVAGTIVRREPVAVLRPPLTLTKRTSATLEGGAKIVVAGDRGGVGAALASRLEQLGVDVVVIDDAPAADELVGRIEAWRGRGTIAGVYWLPALDPHGDLATAGRAETDEAIRVRVTLLFAVMKSLTSGGDAPFLVCATRLGGLHGIDPSGATNPIGGAVCGFAKSYKRENPNVLVKVADFGGDHADAVIAELLVAETRSDPGAVEIGYAADRRWTIATLERQVGQADPKLELGRESVFVVTGAAGSIVSAIVGDLARASAGGTFYLLDLAPEPDPQDPDLARLEADRDGLKRDLFERIVASGKRATPAAVEKQLAHLERGRAAAAAIAAIEATGGTAHYISLDLRDPDAVAAAIDRVRAECGRIDALVHAAGLEVSHRLADKSAAEFDLVFGVKVDGWRNLLSAIGDMPLGATVSFSSIAGRFGNGGQTDYAAANELLAKSSSGFATTRPSTRGITIDWTAWADIGMASRGSIPKMMELAEIDMLPPSLGIPVVRRELEAGTHGEVVIAQGLGRLLDELDDTGGLDVGALSTVPRGPMNATIVGMPVTAGLQVETTLDPRAQPFLFDHQIDGTPVLPGVMGLEGFGEIARALFPDWRVAEIKDVEFLAPFKFYRQEPRTVTVYAQLVAEGDELIARCRLVGRRTLVGQERPQVTTHFRATVVLTQTKHEATVEPPPPEGQSKVEKGDIYRVYFHGPAYQVLETAWRDNGVVIGRMEPQLPDNHRPSELETALDPRLVELCFQTAGVWQIGRTGKMGLPQRIDRVRVLAPDAGSGASLYAVVTPSTEGDSFDAYVADDAGRVYVELSGYRTAELPSAVEPQKRKPLQTAMD